MKIGIIPDIHGRDTWKSFVDDADKLVFLGDYVDTHDPDMTNEAILANLRDLIDYGTKNPDKAVFLLGNHDVPYFYLDKIRNGEHIPISSGFVTELAPELFELFNRFGGLFKLAHQIGDNLFTHAGVSSAWFNKYQDEIAAFWKDDINMNLADVLNGISKTPNRSILFEVGEARGGNWNSQGGIVWACEQETRLGVIPGYHQYVGHTMQEEVNTITFDNGASITYCDVFSNEDSEIAVIDA